MIIQNDTYKIYFHINKINGKMYIGITGQDLSRRFGYCGNGYKKHNIKFWRAICKYGWDNFEHILFADKLTQDQANNMEYFLINKLDTINNGYNCRQGGKVGKLSQQSKDKIKQKRAQQIISRQSIMKTAEKNKGKKRTQEFKNNLHEIKKQKMKQVFCEELNMFFESITSASKYTGISKGCISSACSGFSKTAGKYHWRFIKA